MRIAIALLGYAWRLAVGACTFAFAALFAAALALLVAVAASAVWVLGLPMRVVRIATRAGLPRGFK